MNLGKRIAEARNKKGLTQKELAEACGFKGASRIGNYESGKRLPPLEDLKQLSVILEASTDWLLFGAVTATSGFEKKVPLLQKDQIRHWASGKYYPRRIKTLLSVSDKAFAYSITDAAVEDEIPRGSVGVFDPEESSNLSSYRFALIRHNGELYVKKIVYDLGVLFFAGGLVSIEGDKTEVIAPLISLPETALSSDE